MYLHYLNTKEEKLLMLSVAYLIAVADINTEDERDRMLSVDWNFNLNFVPNEIEFQLIKKYAHEFNIDIFQEGWKYYELYKNDSFSSDFLLRRQLHMTCINNNFLTAMKSLMDQSVHYCELENGVVSLEDRKQVMSVALKKLFETYEISLSQEQRRAILFESISMVFADDQKGECELHLIDTLCHLLRLDRELIQEMNEITEQFSKLYARGLEIIVE